MRKTLKTLIGSAAIAATAVTPLTAQVVREGARTSPKTPSDAEITFGYLCDDRFVVRNEGEKPVHLEYGLAKFEERTALAVDPGESVELLLSTSDELDLFSGGKVIATARREYRDCDEVEDSNGRVIVRPLSVVVAPRVVIASYPYYRSYYDPWYPRRTYFRPIIQPVIRIPITIGGHRSSGGDRGRNDRGRDDRGRNDRGRNDSKSGRRR